MYWSRRGWGGIGSLEYHRAAESIEEGRAAAQLMLPQIKQLLEG